MGRPTAIGQQHPSREAPAGGGPAARAPFVGRRHELDVLDRAVGRVAADGVQVVLVEGPAGIGKSALVRHYLDRRRDLRVIRGSGARATSCPFGLIGQLRGPLGVRGCTRSVPGQLPMNEHVAVGRRVLQGLIGLGGERPVVLVVDDAHLADPDSLHALLFALRRLPGHAVAVVLVARPGEADLPEGLVRLARSGRSGTTLSLGPMLPDEIQDLAAAAGAPGLPLRTAYRVCAHTLGNPGDVLTLLAERPVAEWSRQPVLPAPRVLSRTVAGLLDGCSAEARRLVLAVATLGDPAQLAQAAALADVDEPLPVLEEACGAGLLATPEPGAVSRLAFPTPLVGAAVHAQLRPRGTVEPRTGQGLHRS